LTPNQQSALVVMEFLCLEIHKPDKMNIDFSVHHKTDG